MTEAVNRADDKNRGDSDGLMRLREASCGGEGRRGVGRKASQGNQSREKFFSGPWNSSRTARLEGDDNGRRDPEQTRTSVGNGEVQELGDGQEKREGGRDGRTRESEKSGKRVFALPVWLTRSIVRYI